MAQSRIWERVGIFGLLIVAVAGLLVYVALDLDTGERLDGMQRRLDEMSGRLDAMQSKTRPWVSAGLSIAGDFVSDESGAHLPLTYALRNSGRSPAFNVIAIPALIAAGATIDPSRELEARCGNVVRLVSHASRATDLMSWNYAIFPGKEVIENTTADMKAPKADPAAAIRGTLIVTCVDYRTGHAADHHQTGDVFFLKRGGAGDATADIDPTAKQRIPAAELRLVPARLGTFAN